MSRFDIQLSRESEAWPEEEALEMLAERVIDAAAAYLEVAEGQPFPQNPSELSLVFTDDDSVRAINAEWRGQDKPTNVLSFPAFPVEPGDEPGPMLGDIVLAQETIAREAADLGTPFEEHLSHLLVHGFLHLLGYDHIDPREAERMEALESRILIGLGLSDPYGDSDPI
ncbi:rRNA maturation RNase YbeY [Xaviernesmea oryzae]|uniref:Endoribonuclease YbeY n=1 Tax=Xaviernesmea oryzae TaxID=464029 RepID=A0A1Q9AV30_9HYPH|nr:rRNA maturation RNase YbeY [Xaviernesmea oryzae]OLP59248.1 rRNA maturation RNase YbeY [Xaviernesmea oryzae]SEK79647.1 probable rRNA maturation factor [Xaviernesmea oryzae]